MNNNFVDESHEKDDKKKKIKMEIIEWIKSLAFAFVAALLITKFIFSFTVVRGNSMLPTLQNGDRLIELKIDKLFYKYSRGDIVVIRDKAITNGDFYVKRIVAVGNDNIKVTNGSVYINDKIVNEDYIDNIFTEGELEYTLADDEVFVIGDNRHPNASKDSRVFGPVKRSSIDGRCVFRVYPFNRFGGV